MDGGVERPLRVVSLFETLDNLWGVPLMMEQLFRLPAYIGSIVATRVQLVKELLHELLVRGSNPSRGGYSWSGVQT